MRPKNLALLFPLFLFGLAGALPALTDSSEVSITDTAEITINAKVETPDIEQDLTFLRGTDRDLQLRTIRALPSMKGFPEKARPLIPALLWIMERSGDDELKAVTQHVIDALGWPEDYCMPCLGRFARRQDTIYRMMGLTALTRIAWKDPEAMVILMEVVKDGHGEIGAMSRAISSELQHRDCGNQQDMDDWNDKAAPFMGRMQTALASANWKLRPLAQVILNCPLISDGLKRALQDYLARVPEPLRHVTVEATPPRY